MMFSKPSVSTCSKSLSERKAFFSRCRNAVLFFDVEALGSGDKGRVGEFPSVGELHGVTVGEKFCPDGVFRALGVTALMPRSFSTDASPMLTENVLQELRRERFLGVGGALKVEIIKKYIFISQWGLRWLSGSDSGSHSRRHLRRWQAKSDASCAVVWMEYGAVGEGVNAS